MPDDPAQRSRTAVSGVADRRGSVHLADLARRQATGKDAPRRRTAPYCAVPYDLPVPASAVERAASGSGLPERAPDEEPDARRGAARAGLLGRPIVTASFPAVDDDGWIPPDVGGAAGPDHLVAVHNGAVRVQAKSGGLLAAVTLDGFWAPVAGAGGTFDPKVLYDVGTSRWIIVACDDARMPTSGVLIGVSQTADPTGGWNLYKVGLGGFSAWVDFPSVGFGDDLIVVQVNLLDATATFIMGLPVGRRSAGHAADGRRAPQRRGSVPPHRRRRA
jgi:hypothetical protein